VTDIWLFYYFGDLVAKCLFPPIFWVFFGGGWGVNPLNVVEYCREPQKAHPWPETRVLAYRSCRSVKLCDLAARWSKQKKKKETKESQRCGRTQPPTLRYPHQNCHVGWGPRRSQPCQVSSKSVQGFWLPDESKSAIFLCLALWLT